MWVWSTLQQWLKMYGELRPKNRRPARLYGTALSLATPLNSQHVDWPIHAPPQYLILSST
jgi:hypothetical protein